MTRTPTDEQQQAIDLSREGGSFVVEALAGTGKTSTLEMIADANPTKNIVYVAFNKAIVAEAKGRFPGNVTASTAHSMAMREVGRRYSRRLGNNKRMRGDEIGRHLRMIPFTAEVRGGRKTLAYGFLASHVLKAIRIFCQTADDRIGPQHVPTVNGLDEPRTVETPDGPRQINTRGPNHAALCAHLQPFLEAAWRDLTLEHGSLPFEHGHYLKMWQLTKPDIYADMILYDEAQDMNGCMMDIVASQRNSQLVFVGDSYQQIYEWNGAVNALQLAIPDAPRAWLTESWRFGPGIAMFANKALEWLDAPVELKGRGGENFVGPLPEPDAHLFRTNAGATGEALRLIKAGKKVSIVGGAQDVISFAQAADKLMNGERVTHPELVCFADWGEVLDYVERDPMGSDLLMLVKLVTEFGPDEIMAGLAETRDEKTADVVLSTAHKAKGREWDSVKLAGDFPDPDKRNITPEDVRLLYVAATRPRKMLDPTQVGFFDFQREQR